jgi:hypothetical protein
VWLPERGFETTIQSKRKRDSNIADAEYNRTVLEPRHSTAGSRLLGIDLKSLEDTLRLLLKYSKFTNALIFPTQDFSLFGKVK